MNQALINTSISAALLGLTALAATSPAQAADEKSGSKEKCYGIAKAGQNDCANASGTHACAGQSKADMSADEWKYVAKGSCESMKGSLMSGKDKMMKDKMDKPKA
jgi:uncharacterized membrane protein